MNSCRPVDIEPLHEVLTKIIDDIKEISFKKIFNTFNFPDFLLEDNIDVMENIIDKYKNRHLLCCSEKTLQAIKIVNQYKNINRHELTTDEAIAYTENALKVKLHTEIINRRKLIINEFNETKQNIFSNLIDIAIINKTNIEEPDKIEKLHKEWEERSHFAELSSDSLLNFSEILDKMESYFQLIIEDGNLTSILEKNDLQGLIITANKVLKLIHYEKENLCCAMLSRLVLAISGLPDDVISATYYSIKSIFPKINYIESDQLFKYLFSQEFLSPGLYPKFYDYIIKVNNPLHRKRLDEIYNVNFNKAPEMTSFSDNFHLIGPLVFDYFTLNKFDYSKGNHSGSSFINGKILDCRLVSANFSQSNFAKVVIKNVDARNANFSLANFEEADLQGIYAIKAAFLAADLNKTNFHGGNLSRANFQRTRLKDTVFCLANLQGANFIGAYGSCNFDGANLTGANLAGMELEKISFNGAVLIGAQFIQGETENEIIFELNILKERIKHHASKEKLLAAIEQNVLEKLDKYANKGVDKNEDNNEDDDEDEVKKIKTSPLLQHALFVQERKKTSPLYIKEKTFLSKIF